MKTRKITVLKIEGAYRCGSRAALPLTLSVPSMRVATELMRLLEKCECFDEDFFPERLNGQYVAEGDVTLHPLGEMSIKSAQLPENNAKPSPIQPKATGLKRLPAPKVHLLGYGDTLELT